MITTMSTKFIVIILVSFFMVLPILSPSSTVVEGDLLIFFPSLYQFPWEAMWTPEISGGTPRFVNPQLGILYPLAWPFAVNFHMYLPIYFLLHVWIAGLGVLFWLQHRSAAYPLYGALLYSCSGAMFGLITKPDKLPGYAFLPWFIFGLALLFSKEKRHQGWFIAVFSYALSWFGGSIEGCVLMTTWGLVLACTNKNMVKNLSWLAGVGLVAVFLISINFIPLLMHLPYTTRAQGGDWGQVTELSMQLVDLTRLLVVDDAFSPISDVAQREHYLPSIYVGFSGFICICIGSWRHSRKHLWFLAGIFLFLALGSNTPIYKVISYIPLLKTIQYPEKYWLGILPVLAYWGACGAGYTPRIRQFLLCILGLECIACAWLTFSVHDPKEVYAKPKVVDEIFSRWSNPKDAPLFWDDTLHKSNVPMMMKNRPLYETIHESLYPNVGVDFGVGYILGSDRLRVARHGNVVASAIEAEVSLRHRLLKRMGASFFYSWKNEDTLELQSKTSLQYLGGGLFWEENPSPLIFWSGETLFAKTMPPILSLMASSTTAVMVLEEDPNWESIPKLDGNAAPSSLKCSAKPHKPGYECSWNASADGVLVLRQNWLPGWHATLDGKEHLIAPVNAYMVGAFAPKGEHTLTLEYRTPFLWLGLGLSIFGMCGALLIGYRLFIGREEQEVDLPGHSAGQ